MAKKEHICLYTEDYRTINEFEPSLIHIGLTCKDCGNWISCAGEAETFKKVPIGSYTVKGQSQKEREVSHRKSIAIRNKHRKVMELPPLEYQPLPTQEERDEGIKKLLDLIGANHG